MIEKYNFPVPRYTSYPTVPYWENNLEPKSWKESVKMEFDATNSTEGISLYIHLPFCESLCTYCACNTRITVNHQVEKPYIQSLLKEWQLYLEIVMGIPKIKELHLGGGTPTFFSPLNLKELIEGILSRSELHPDANLSFEAHPDNTTLEHLQVFYRLGFKRLSFGIQDFNVKVQEAINRFQNFEFVFEKISQARQIGFTSINVDLVYGLPFQTLKSLEDSLDKVIQLKPDRIAFYSYAHVPWLKPGQRKFNESDLPSNELKRSLYEKGRDKFIENGYFEIGMDHFSLPTDDLWKSRNSGRLHRNFMGYTSGFTKLLIGLGVSSISDSWNAFSQNVKTVEEYNGILSQNKLPLLRGHQLNNEDLILRKHILQLMCNFNTKWENLSEQTPGLFEGLVRMEPLIKDGLIDIDQHSLSITELGKPFLRNICMCLDARYFAVSRSDKIFSTSI